MSRISRAGFVAAVAVLVAIAVAAPSLARQALPQQPSAARDGLPATYVLPPGTLFPEGLGYDERTGDYFVGVIGGGAVLRGNVNERDAVVFSPAGADGRAAALGAQPDHGRVFVGSLGGKAWVYAERSGKLLAVLDTRMKTSLLNDFAFLPNGTAFVTDSINPFLWRIVRGSDGRWRIEKWIDFTGTPFKYVKGVNADGIVASPDGRYLVVNQLTPGKLWRIEVATKGVTEVTKAGGGSFALRNSDGMDLAGDRTLYVARNANAEISKVRLSGDFSTGTLVNVTRNRAFQFPSAVAVVGNRLLVLNSQLDKFIAMKPPVLPFTISSIPRP
jgi:Cu-Zn family superoxide dismutase